MKAVFQLIFLVLLIVLAVWLLEGARQSERTALPVTVTDSGEGKASLIFCSQNLHRFGDDRNAAQREAQLNSLADRIAGAGCDVVAVQEVYGKSSNQASKNLEQIANAVAKRLGQEVLDYVGSSNDRYIRNGFLLKASLFDVLEVKSFARAPVSKLSPLGPNRRFYRGPLMLRLRSRDASGREFVFFSFHLKSKAHSYKDPTQTQFETRRMESADSLRDIASSYFDSATVLLAGDRNTTAESASAKILEGSLDLDDFLSRNCELDNSISVRCRTSVRRRPELLPLFSTAATLDPSPITGGSYVFKGSHQLIDEILIESDEGSLAFDSNGVPDVGFVGRFGRGSDHRLLKVALRW